MELLAWVQTIGEHLKPALECLAILAGALALIKWIRERNDRATDVLLQLEKDFWTGCKAGRAAIEDRDVYKEVAPALLAYTIADDETRRRETAKLSDELGNQVEAIDTLLRFYVVLVGVRRAGQVPDAALSACYRFWPAHYYHTGHVELRDYINRYFPTVRDWLLEDLIRPRPFFRPADFWDENLIERNAAQLYTRR